MLHSRRLWITKGFGTDRRRDLARTVAVISKIGADILALQEADTRFGTRTGLLDLVSIRRELGLIAVPLDGVGDAHGWNGNLQLVRNALMHEVHQLILTGFASRCALVAEMLIGGQPLRAVNAHLGLLPGSRAAQARALLDKLGGLEARPTLLMGDLNEWRDKSAALKTLGEQFTIGLPGLGLLLMAAPRPVRVACVSRNGSGRAACKPTASLAEAGSQIRRRHGR